MCHLNPTSSASLLILLFSGLFLIGGCRKSDDYNSSAGCITRILPKVNDVNIRQGAYDTAMTLLRTNGVDVTSLDPEAVYYYPPDSNGTVVTLISARQFVNGLMIRSGGFNFFFYNGTLKVRESQGTIGSPENNDTTPKLSLNRVRQIFMDSKPYDYTGIIGMVKKEQKWADSCVLATLLYDEKGNYDPALPLTKKLIKVWSVYTESRGVNRPVALIPDDTGKAVPADAHLD